MTVSLQSKERRIPHLGRRAQSVRVGTYFVAAWAPGGVALSLRSLKRRRLALTLVPPDLPDLTYLTYLT